MLMKMWRKGNYETPLVGMQIGTAIVKYSLKVAWKLKTKLLYDSVISAGVHIQRKLNSMWKIYFHSDIYFSIIHNHENMEPT